MELSIDMIVSRIAGGGGRVVELLEESSWWLVQLLFDSIAVALSRD